MFDECNVAQYCWKQMCIRSRSTKWFIHSWKMSSQTSVLMVVWKKMGPIMWVRDWAHKMPHFLWAGGGGAPLDCNEDLQQHTSTYSMSWGIQQASMSCPSRGSVQQTFHITSRRSLFSACQEVGVPKQQNTVGRILPFLAALGHDECDTPLSPANNLYIAFVRVARSRCLSSCTVIPFISGRAPQYWVCRLHIHLVSSFRTIFRITLFDGAAIWKQFPKAPWHWTITWASRSVGEKHVIKSYTSFLRTSGIADWTKWRGPGRRTWGQCFKVYNTAKSSFRRWIIAWFITTNSDPTSYLRHFQNSLHGLITKFTITRILLVPLKNGFLLVK